MAAPWNPMGFLWVPNGLPMGPHDPPRVSELSSIVNYIILELFGTHPPVPLVPPVPRVPRKWWHEVLFGALLPHAPGVRMTVVTLTPSNYTYI